MKRGCAFVSAIMYWWPAFVLAGCAGFAAWGLAVGWNNSIIDCHGFRQTQTAMTAYYLAQSFPIPSLDTPVFGYPWAVPFELPLYQWFVAALVVTLNTPLDQTARFVSTIFFVLTLLPGNAFLKTLSVPSRARCVFLALFLATPFYIYWSRTCLIESTALFFSVSYLAYSNSYLRNPTKTGAGLAILCGSLAGCVKVTTFLPFFLLTGVVYVSASFSMYARNRTTPWFRDLAWKCVILLVLPFAATTAWTRFADMLKSQNAMACTLTSTQLTHWTFGPLKQRCDVNVWRDIFGHMERCLGYWFVPIIVLCLAGACLSGRRMREYLCCLALYGLVPCIFTNLYFVHEYYQYASMIFLVSSVGFVVTGLLECARIGRFAAPALVAVVLVSSVTYYCEEFYKRQMIDDHKWDPIASYVQSITSPDEVIVVVGCHWSSEVPYYCCRRALMCVSRQGSNREGPGPFLAQYNLLLERGYRIGAVIVRTETSPLSPSQIKKLIVRARLGATPVVVPAGFEVYH